MPNHEGEILTIGKTDIILSNEYWISNDFHFIHPDFQELLKKLSPQEKKGLRLMELDFDYIKNKNLAKGQNSLWKVKFWKWLE